MTQAAREGARPSLMVVGSANADLVVQVSRRPAAGETVLGQDLATHPGGKGANQAVAAGLLQARVALLARVGQDGHGQLLRDSLAAAGVDLSSVIQDPQAPTGVAMITVDEAGDNSIVVAPGANAHLSPADVDAAAQGVRGARVVSVQLEIPVATVQRVVAVMDPQARLVLNPSPPQELPKTVLQRCDPLVLNEHEAAVLVGTEVSKDVAPREWVQTLLRSGPRSVVLTLGAEGALVGTGAGIEHVPAQRVEVLDTTGAGDAFTAALCTRLVDGDDLLEAARFATSVAAVAVTRAGAQSSYPSAVEARESAARLS